MTVSCDTYFGTTNEERCYTQGWTATNSHSNLWQNVWSHWAFTKNATTGVKNIYCNGALVGTTAAASQVNGQHIDAVMLGGGVTTPGTTTAVSGRAGSLT